MYHLIRTSNTFEGCYHWFYYDVLINSRLSIECMYSTVLHQCTIFVLKPLDESQLSEMKHKICRPHD